MNAELASVLSHAEGEQIYNLWQEESGKLGSYCSSDASGDCIYPYIGLIKPAGVSNANKWSALKWTDGNDLDFVDWGGGKPDISKALIRC